MNIDIWWDEREKSTKFTLLEPIDLDGWVVPAGYESDGASIPRWLWTWCSPFDARYIAIFTWHDWAYDEGIDRHVADTIMMDLLLLAGMRRTQALAIYYAVRLFGESHFHRV